MENRFNLIDSPWIPVAGQDRVSLRDIFINSELGALGGNPVQKIALMKLLLSIAQAAATPKDEREWKSMGVQGLSQKCLAYLDQWHEKFYLHGDQPFLQMPSVNGVLEKRTQARLSLCKTASKSAEAISSGAPKQFGAGFYPDLPTDNNTVLSHTLMAKTLGDAEQALFLVCLMNFAFGGKRVESSTTSLSGQFMGRQYTAGAGPSLGGWTGYMHCFPLTGSILNDLWVNLLTYDNIQSLNRWPSGLGVPVWEKMPVSEACPIAQSHKESYQSCLVALSRFVLLVDGGILYLDGLKYPSVKEGLFEPSLILNNSGKEIKVKYVDPERRPWRELQSLLSFFSSTNDRGFEAFSMKNGIDRIVDHFPLFSVWCGGLKVSPNSGDQSVKQKDDFVESCVWLSCDMLGDGWFSQLKLEMDGLDGLAKNLYGRVMSFFKEQKVDGGKAAARASNAFWHLCERDFQALVDSCGQDEESRTERQRLRRRYASYVQQAYDAACPKESARQLDAWAKCRPNNYKYLMPEA